MFYLKKRANIRQTNSSTLEYFDARLNETGENDSDKSDSDSYLSGISSISEKHEDNRQYIPSNSAEVSSESGNYFTFTNATLNSI